MNTYDVFDVFTPSQKAVLNFIERDELTKTLVDALRTPGKQIVVYGPSGSGKSTLLLNKLLQLYEDHITTPCEVNTTFDQLLLNAFDKIDKYFTSATRSKTSDSGTSSLEASYIGIKLRFDAAGISEAEHSQTRIVPPQLTADRLAEFLGAKGLCWVIDDFHKIAPEHKQRLAQCMKIFYDTSSHYKKVKIIVIGAVGTAREVVEYDPEMRTRVSELGIPLMNDDELDLILENGSHLLNVVITPKIRAEIVRYSAGLASVCHQLALNMCLERDIENNQEEPFVFSNEDFNKAVKRYIAESSDSLKSVYEKALYRPRAIQKFDNCRLIMSALAKGPIDGMLYGELLSAVRESVSDYPQSNLSNYLKELQQTKRGEVLKYDSKTGKYCFALPIYQAYGLALMSEKLTPTSKRVIKFNSNVTTLEMQNQMEEIQKKLFEILQRVKPRQSPE